MPFTPIHLGVAAPVKAVCPNQFSVTVFAMAQVLMDLEPLIKMIAGRDDLHALTHNLPGTLGLALATILLWYLLMAIKPRALFQDFQRMRPGAVAFSALYGTVSHLYLDILYHAEVAATMGYADLPGSRVGAERLAAFGLVLGALLWGGRYFLKRRRAETRAH